jgi:hypothetical protein
MNPGCSFMLGWSARRATSTPDTKDWRKKFARSATRDANLSCDRFGGRRLRLAQVAPATAASPTGRSVKPHPEIISQKARKSAARTAAARGKPTGTSSPGLNAPIQDWKRSRRTATRGAGHGRSAHAHRPMGSASAVSSLSAATRVRAIMFIQTAKALGRLAKPASPSTPGQCQKDSVKRGAIGLPARRLIRRLLISWPR